ncbi:MAG TPA: lysylphosphatidylglycerol synthase domain-containing protein, partial [Candidatus Eisenbacteria bacterium]|nr:lysylphosphatidylglycerol synthase domain-containing protein [Candidatus Eisenbacteria bacterium]
GRRHQRLSRIYVMFAMMQPWNLGGVLLCNAIAAGLTFLLLDLARRAVAVAGLAFTDVTFGYGLAHILSGLSFMPGGVGSQEAIVVGLLATQGVPASAGAAAGLLFRAFNDVLMALVGAAAGLLVRRAAGRNRE